MQITVKRTNANPGFEHCRYKASNGYLEGYGRTESKAIDALNERIGRIGWKGDHDFSFKPEGVA